MSDTVKVNNSSNIQPHLSYKGKKEFSTELDQNAFMKLMLEQLKQQDPLSPMDNSQFLQQTSMMTMVEKLTKMTMLMEQSNNSMLTLREYENLIGRTATYDLQQKDELTGDVTHTKKTAMIESVYLDQGKIYFRMKDEPTPIARDWVEGLESKGFSGNSLDNSLKYADMIGKEVSYKESRQVDQNGQSSTVDEIKNGVIVGFTMKNNAVQFQLDNGSSIGVENITGMSVKPENLPMDHTLQYAQMIGYSITFTESNTQPDGSSSTTESSGLIKAVSMKNGLVEFVLDDGKKVKLNQITGYEAQAYT
ncbi:flagellar hook capping protein [Brevibacillus ruminantium]|uniref:Basal-body rod modification protein FlgD n=1 Tax=Brevibacillus ruminantium TaxID=2950604 RepID=A0ABY4WIU4_9BACL|nr:flagellar hook capping FlgD N-terminal domain-containing protein [Brevibacillus ruminantium]USG65269.1 flagellar hook capping protein [Brevibacillus ruminantium]